MSEYIFTPLIAMAIMIVVAVMVILFLPLEEKTIEGGQSLKDSEDIKTRSAPKDYKPTYGKYQWLNDTHLIGYKFVNRDMRSRNDKIFLYEVGKWSEDAKTGLWLDASVSAVINYWEEMHRVLKLAFSPDDITTHNNVKRAFVLAASYRLLENPVNTKDVVWEFEADFNPDAETVVNNKKHQLNTTFPTTSFSVRLLDGQMMRVDATYDVSGYWHIRGSFPDGSGVGMTITYSMPSAVAYIESSLQRAWKDRQQQLRLTPREYGAQTALSTPSSLTSYLPFYGATASTNVADSTPTLAATPIDLTSTWIKSRPLDSSPK